MNKLFAILICLGLLLCACGSGDTQDTTASTTAPSAETTEVPPTTEAPAQVVTGEVKAQLDAVLAKNQYKGIVYLTHNGKVVYQSVSGTNDLGEPLTIESPMYIASVSKQFCAAAILMLRDQGKLSLDDPLSQYFPEYTIGKEITVKNLLTMRSGILRDVTPMWDDPEAYTEQTKDENTAAFKEWIFAQPLNFEPDTSFEYSNVNYTLLSLIVETVSGQAYKDFVYQNILDPLGMSHTGFVDEIQDTPNRAPGLTYENVHAVAQVPMAIQGCGDITSTAADMDIWMTALKSGQVVCEESYREMTTNYSPELPLPTVQMTGYGYGLNAGIRNGWGHPGNNGAYASLIYFNEEYGYNLYMNTAAATSIYNMGITQQTAHYFLGALFTAVDAAVSD